MILESLFRIALSKSSNGKQLPTYVQILRPGFKFEYHIREVVSLASRVCGHEKSVGVSREGRARVTLSKAISIIHDARLVSTVAGWGIRDVPKAKITTNVHVCDLRPQFKNVHGDAHTRLMAAANNNASEIILRSHHRYAAVKKAQETDIFIVETAQQSAYLQHFLARANLATVVATHNDVEGYYSPESNNPDEWSTPFLTHT
jgi:hypothetical protein